MDLWLIGIGTGNPEHVTLEAQRALREAALILVPRKGPDKSDLAGLRHRIIAEAGATAPVQEFDYPTRDPNLPYKHRVRAWHDEIALCWQDAIAKADPHGPVALLVWGDPSLYDSTLRIATRLEPAPKLRVLPGITALHALTAAHGITFNTLAGAVTVTTGRRLRDHGWPYGAETVAVMLDGDCGFRSLDRTDLMIWWGAYLGMEEQILDHGPVVEAGPRIVEARARARADHGWIMDTYVLRPMGLD
ncbi:precorrin-6A synthase (deacetylating) [Jannaschia sp. CCS1]|uniref:precorrin-6A synthase (deacetylating) n=1 Tax=Jannaschia sp. (strain CCS1) TaxID=290400 RepID=UPI000053A925|nr:precorrin-6A synthase (deacetylating) [Jannaschia sp. CCS1]ABD55837.1 precorrin-6A synthase (deacetylating) [Jannaschia sp. CCS1]